ncbi:hypothetical protein CCM_08419 [Cordyceps militaris CM01]|uniref:Uncharacterized protein n=1 Tax=Cordyceps militaris (strain CM01) TaxID=983644 RepID=G3JR80_CORMM|nr:uncharacterized protein CCM_08419 [Cordyceps militaris CM01]EGX88376.1 hypothetical protein CCM_08419 [Cordyceps militaris CM01]
MNFTLRVPISYQELASTAPLVTPPWLLAYDPSMQIHVAVLSSSPTSKNCNSALGHDGHGKVTQNILSNPGPATRARTRRPRAPIGHCHIPKRAGNELIRTISVPGIAKVGSMGHVLAARVLNLHSVSLRRARRDIGSFIGGLTD